MRNKMKILVFGLLTLMITIHSCERDYIFPSADNPIEEFVNIMDYWYFWNDSLPTINLKNYSNPEDLLEDIRYKPKDKWSYISTKQEEDEYYNEGVYIGHGFGYAVDNDGKIRISYLFQSSDLVNDGVTRGWKINKINGTAIDQNSNISSLLGASSLGVSNTFELESPESLVITKTYAKEEVTINTVLHKSVIDVGLKKVGYLVFESFINPSKTELSSAFTYFKSQEVSELIIDLRYNGGGLMDIANYLAGLIIPNRLDNELFLKYIHNKNRTSENGSYKFNVNANSLKLERVYFITSNGSASASEALINGLIPYLEVYMVGDDSYGKPVGMYSFRSKLSDYVYVPITFKIVNSDGEGDYYDGLPADAYAADDITHNFGDINESSLAEALYHIQYGSFSGKKLKEGIKRMPKKPMRSIRDELDAY